MTQINLKDLDPAAKEQFWEENIEQLKQSKLTRSEYCRQRGLKLHQLIYWKKRFARKQNGENGRVSFVALNVASAVKPVTANNSLRLFTPNGYRIEIGYDFDAGALKKLIAVLQVS